MIRDQDEPSADYGVVGVGSLAEAIVTGLCENQASPPKILLSPRSRERSARLAQRFSTVEVATDNQAAVSNARTLLLCVRPQEAHEVMAAIELRSDQQVISVMGRVSSAEVARLSAPATQVSRAIPSMAVAGRSGFTPVFPAGSGAEELFDRLGGSMVLEHEDVLEATSAASATVATHFSYLRTVSGWLAGQGVDPTTADRYIASVFAGVGSELAGVSDLAPLAAAHATRGGLNERIEQTLREHGVFAEVADALDELHRDLTNSDRS